MNGELCFTANRFCLLFGFLKQSSHVCTATSNIKALKKSLPFQFFPHFIAVDVLQTYSLCFLFSEQLQTYISPRILNLQVLYHKRERLHLPSKSVFLSVLRFHKSLHFPSKIACYWIRWVYIGKEASQKTLILESYFEFCLAVSNVGGKKVFHIFFQSIILTES